ncbi:MAG: hypothetical protein IT352_09640, partial [Gemmatimonadales bacterium]|nr:hypothetical protein [Gemmatimonadales bacterium]
LTKEGIPALASVKSEVEAKVRLQKKRQEAERLAESLAKQVAGGTALADAAKTMGFEYRELGPFARLTAPLGSPTLIGAAFGLGKGQISRPLSTEDGNSDPAIYLFQGIDRVSADSADFVKNLASIRQQALQAAKRSRVQAYLTALRESAKVVDRRGEVYRTAAQNAAASTSLQQ